MANEFFTATGAPSTRSAGSSAVIRAEFAALQEAFDKLPTMTGNASKLVRVNASGNALAADLGVGSSNTASTVVQRDASGNFAAGTITAALNGNAATATKLATARTINGVSFDGTSDITISVSDTAAQLLTKLLTVDGAGSGLDADTLDGLDAAKFLRSDAASVLDGGNTATPLSLRRSSAGSLQVAMLFEADNGTTNQKIYLGSHNGTLKVGPSANLSADGLTVWHSGNLSPSAYAPLDSPSFTGDVLVPLQAAGNTTNRAASTAFVQQELANYAPLAAPSFTGLASSSGGYRATGLANAASGKGLELGYSTDISYVSSFDRTAGAYLELRLRGTPVRLMPEGSTVLEAQPTFVRTSTKTYTVPVSVAFAAAMVVDAADSNVFVVGNLTGNVTSLTINNPTQGQFITLRFKQDATGGRTVALPAGAKVEGSIASGASRTSYLNLTYNSTESRWEGNWWQVPA
ncbi:MAG: hypothetical protein HY856_13640 [Burkholderiales bacterium]|nr:hypothetical protein [Burkholderiales bacterium]